MFLICFAFVSSHIMNATDVNPLFYSALLLSALPVPLLRQVYFFVFLRFFFRVCFLLVFWKVLEGSFGARMAHFGSILRSFGSHFGDFLRIRWIFKNVGFTIVKHQFLKIGADAKFVDFRSILHPKIDPKIINLHQKIDAFFDIDF